MNIYTNFVYPDKLISPVNGYECERITKQNIKSFGFDTIEHLLMSFPDFPLLCDTYRESRRQVAIDNNPSQISSIKSQTSYMHNMSKCLVCGKNLSYNKRHQKFCSRSCAASFNNTGRQWTEKSTTALLVTRELNKHLHNSTASYGQNNPNFKHGKYDQSFTITSPNTR